MEGKMEIIDYQRPRTSINSHQLFERFVFKAIDLNYLKKTEDAFVFFWILATAFSVASWYFSYYQDNTSPWLELLS